ncbi:MAG: HEAT repeat domain-containing protein [Verrucomicrobiales bacterium]|nr:HEAT repeat domain-containing protein [Verrucomicrobiales bacterium]
MQHPKVSQRDLFRSGFLGRLSWLPVCLLIAVALAGGSAWAQGKKVFRAGTHIVDITPTRFPVLVNAMFTERTATNVADRLHVRSLALDDGTTRVVMAVIDTCMVARDLMDRAKEQASQVTGIPVEKMLVSATHTHSAPSAMGCLGSRMDTNYARFLEPLIAEAIIGAARNLTPARIGWGSVDDWDHTFNRRWIRRPDRLLTDPFGQKSVRAHMHPGHQSPDAVGPSGPVDPGLSVVALQTLDGKYLALLGNYSQHYYGSPLISSDYYGRFCKYMAEFLGGQAPGVGAGFLALMSQGTSGDLMWMDYAAPARDIGYDAYAREMATLATDVVRRIEFQDWVPLGMAERTIELSYRAPDADRLTWARRLAKTFEGRLPSTLPEVYSLEALALHERPRTELKLQALRIGDLGITALPNEVFALTGLKLKAQSPFRQTFNIELANGAEGYIPPPEQHRLGGYTTWPARTAGLEERAEPRIVETLLSLLEDLSGSRRIPMTNSHGAYARAVLASQPAAYWRLEEGVIPTAYDASEHRRNATFEDGIALFLPGASATVGFHPARLETTNAFSGPVINRAVHFAGGRLRAGAPRTRGAYTAEFWVWNGLPTSVRDTTGYLFSRGDDGVYGAPGEHLSIGGTRTVPGRLVFSNGGSDRSQSLVGKRDLPWRTWHHVVLVRDGKRVAAYVNGETDPDLAGELEPGRETPTEELFFGGRSDGAFGLEGKLDEVAWYDRALAPGEIEAHFNASTLVKPSRAAALTPAAPVPVGTGIQALRPIARWLASVSEGQTLLGGPRQPVAIAEAGVAVPAADAVAARFSGGRIAARVPGLGANYSAAFWFYNELPTTVRPVTGYLFSRGEDGADGAPGDHLGIGGSHSNAGVLIWFNGNQRDEIRAGRTQLVPLTWHHVVLVREGRRVRVHLDGASKPEIDAELEPTFPPANPQVFWGGRNDGFASLNGRLTDIALFDRALSAEEIASILPLASLEKRGQASAASSSTVANEPLSPAASLAKIHVPEGFRVDLVASEPLVESPVAIDWDERGRLWVVEMVDYPLGLDGQGKAGGRIRILEDVDRDGRYDKSTLFAEGLSFPTGLLCWRDGVLVTAAPEILFLKDGDGDGKAEVREVRFSGFFEGNQQLRVNGLRWGLDNWVYCASGAHHGGYGTATKIRSHLNGQDYAIGSRDFRFNPDTGELDAQSGPSQFGRNPDNWGNWFGVQNSWPLWHYVLADQYLRRNPYVAAPNPVHQVVTPNNPKVFPASAREKRFHSFGESGHFTSACAAMIYRDDLLSGTGELRHAFTCEPFHNLVQHNLVHEDGVTFKGTRAEVGSAMDFFASEDRWCRPVMTRTGPDGALWVVDMYRYMIEHPEWLPPEGKAELLPHYRRGEDRGRIYRVLPRLGTPRPVPALASATSDQLVETLESPNGWQRDKAQMLLLWRQDLKVVPLLEKLARESSAPLGRLHALCTMDGLGSLPVELLTAAFRDPHPGVRIHALRLSETRLTPEILSEAVRLASDSEPKVVLQLALTLGQWRDPRAGATLARIAVSHGTDRFIQAAVLSSSRLHVLPLIDGILSADGGTRAGWVDPLLNLALATEQREPLARLLSRLLTGSGETPDCAQMDQMGRFLDGLSRRKSSWSALRLGEATGTDALNQQLDRLPSFLASVERLSRDSGAAAATRLSAGALLVREERYRGDALRLLAELLNPRVPGELQQGVVKAMGRSADRAVPEIIGRAWPVLLPEIRRKALDELLGREAWCLELLRLAENGTIPRTSLDAASAGRLLRHASPQVKEAAGRILSEPVGGSRVGAVDALRPALSIEGDAGRGAVVFSRLCASCHRLGTQGSDLGPNLQSVANHPPEKLLVSIVDPNASIEPGFTAYTATMSDGEELYGLIAAETGNSLVFKLADGKTRPVLRSDIATLSSGNLSLMPEGLEVGLKLQEVADLIRFIRSSGNL